MPEAPLTSGSRPSVIASVSGRPSVSTQDPSGRDADRDHLEPFGVEVAQDAACGNARDGVLGAASAVDDGDADATLRPVRASQPREATAPAEPRMIVPAWRPGAFSRSACSMSATRSSVSSMPSESRANPSATGSPHRARRSTDVWMPPKLVAATSRSLRATSSCTAAASASSTATSPPKRFICRFATACDGSSGSPG